MKVLLLLAFSFATGSCLGQDVKPDNRKAWEKVSPGMWRVEQWTSPKPFRKTVPSASPLLQGYIAGKAVPAGVYRFPGSGMTCIVPDRTEIAGIPNAFGAVSVPFRTTIPNVLPHTGPQSDVPSK